MNSDQLAQLATMGYTDPQAFFQAVIDGQVRYLVDRQFHLPV